MPAKRVSMIFNVAFRFAAGGFATKRAEARGPGAKGHPTKRSFAGTSKGARGFRALTRFPRGKERAEDLSNAECQCLANLARFCQGLAKCPRARRLPGVGYFRPKEAGMREGRSAVTAAVARHATMTSAKNPTYPSRTCNAPAAKPGSIMLIAMNAVHTA